MLHSIHSQRHGLDPSFAGTVPNWRPFIIIFTQFKLSKLRNVKMFLFVFSEKNPRFLSFPALVFFSSHFDVSIISWIGGHQVAPCQNASWKRKLTLLTTGLKRWLCIKGGRSWKDMFLQVLHPKGDDK